MMVYGGKCRRWDDHNPITYVINLLYEVFEDFESLWENEVHHQINKKGIEDGF